MLETACQQQSSTLFLSLSLSLSLCLSPLLPLPYVPSIPPSLSPPRFFVLFFSFQSGFSLRRSGISRFLVV
ncbi:unnamed protein product [Lactuca virosa]|uniref:Secreted protein n=1 Tax=Lactuca virosa TaxID=75947 RepID=A0AAU9MKE8_9ASTR|nr:unnamed protein product [Lactuca virosa]